MSHCVKRHNNIRHEPTRSTSSRLLLSECKETASTTERVMATTMSVDEYFDELITQVHEDYSTMSIEEAREMTLKAVREEYAKS